MIVVRIIAVFLLATLPAIASEATLYERLAQLDVIKSDYVAQRTAHGIDFVSRERVTLESGQEHAKYHIEIEGPLPGKGLTSIDQVAKAVAYVIKSEVDTTQVQENPIAPGVNVDFVDINGTVVAILDYRANNEGSPYRQRIALLSGDGIYTATMSLHTANKKDPAGLALIMLVVAMINSGEIEGLPAAVRQQ